MSRGPDVSPEPLPAPVRLLLWLFPGEVRREYGQEMLAVLRAWRLDRAESMGPRRFWLRACADLTVAGLRLRFRSLGRRRATSPRRPPSSSPRWSPAAMAQDLRYALRALRKSPSFTATAILLLMIGIGANAAIFSLVSTFLLKPYPYGDPDRIVSVHTSAESWGIEFGNVSLADYLDLREADVGLSGIALYGYRSYNVASDEAAVWVATAHVSADFFDVLRLEPLMGRTFRPGEDGEGANVVVLSEGLWRSELGGDPDIVGSDLLLDGEAHRVVGVIPGGTEFPDSRRMWKAWLRSADTEPRYRRVYRAVGRIADGQSIATVRERLTALGDRLAADYPDSNEGMSLVVQSLREERDGDLRPMLLTLTGAAVVLLLLVCANLANLLLSRSRDRRREMAVRAALGAGRLRIVRQLVLESVILALAGGGAGVVVGQQTIRALLTLRPRPLPDWYSIGLDWRVVAFSCVVSLTAAVGFGLLPALRLARGDVQQVLRLSDSAVSASRGERRLLSGLIVLEVALSVVLLVGAALMASSFRNITTVDPGFALENRITVAVAPPSASYDNTEAAALVAELERSVAALPGVEAVGSAAILPLMGTGTTGVTAEGQTESEASDNPSIQFSPVTPGFFEAMGMELLRGRGIEEADRPDGLPVVVVSDGMVRRFWPGDDAVGRRLQLNSEERWFTVVGVVEDVRYGGLTGEIGPQMYLAHAQDPWRGMSLVVHTVGEPGAALPGVRRALRDLDPTIALHSVITLPELYDLHSFDWRFSALLFWIFAGIAGLLASIGVYAVLAYGVERRTREIGIRKALGAADTNLVGRVAREAGGLIGVGLAVGLSASVAAGDLLASQLYGVDPHEPIAYLAVAALMAAVALVATILPARRAARLDPVTALRKD